MTDLRMDPGKCPPKVVDTLRNYILHGLKPGSFVMSVLENDLQEAVQRADSVNLPAIPHIIAWLIEYAPVPCWGDEHRVRLWLGLSKLYRDKAVSDHTRERLDMAQSLQT